MPPSSFAATPRLSIEVNGQLIDGPVQAEITSTNHFSADRFRITIALGTASAASGQLWSDVTPLFLALGLSVDGITYREMIRGYVDEVRLDSLHGRVVVEGRDLTSQLLESQLAETFPNRTSSEIATLLASSHGLKASVTATATPVGRYYQNEHDTTLLECFSEAVTEWDLLVLLARLENFDLFVSGETLYFNPPTPAWPPRFIQPTDTTGLRFKRSVRLAAGVSVTVKSWNSSQGTSITGTASSPLSSDQINSAEAQLQKPLNFVLLRPNLTISQATALASLRASELTQHERVVEIDMPGDLTLSARDRIGIAFTRTKFDQIYNVDSIVRTIGPAGFRQSITARYSSYQPPAAAQQSGGA